MEKTVRSWLVPVLIVLACVAALAGPDGFPQPWEEAVACPSKD